MGMPLLKAHCTKCGEQVLIDMSGYEDLNRKRREEAVAIAEDHLYVQLMDVLGLPERPTNLKDAVLEALAKSANEQKQRADRLDKKCRALTEIVNKAAAPVSQVISTNIAVS